MDDFLMSTRCHCADAGAAGRIGAVAGAKWSEMKTQRPGRIRQEDEDEEKEMEVVAAGGAAGADTYDVARAIAAVGSFQALKR